jgi:Protein  of unknown function (DUF3018)
MRQAEAWRCSDEQDLAMSHGKSQGAPKQQPSKFARYRARKRAQGLRLKRMWVLDTSAPGFQEEVNRQLAILREAPEEKEVMDWLEAVTSEVELPPYDWPEEKQAPSKARGKAPESPSK